MAGLIWLWQNSGAPVAVRVFGGGWLRRRDEQRKREDIAMKYAIMAVGAGAIR